MSETTVGIIIGSMFTLLGVITNGIITFVLNRSSHNKDVEEHKRCEHKKDADEKKVKRETAYHEFVNYYGFMNLILGVAHSVNSDPSGVNAIGDIFTEKFKENLSRTAEVISRVSLYGSDAIGEKCGKYSAMWNAACQKQSQGSLAIEDLANLDQELLSVVHAMKEELGIDNL